MPALSSPNTTLWRTAPYSIKTYCFLHAPAIIFQARVNQSFFLFPMTSITYDGVVGSYDYTDIEEGMTLLLGTTQGGDDLGRVRVAKNSAGTVASSTAIVIQRASQGTNDGELNPADDAWITVLNLRKVWATPPTIDTNGVTYMDNDKAFTSNRSFPPIANGDPDVLVVIEDDATEVELSFGNVAAIVTNPDATSSVTHAWAFDSTCTPATSSDAAPSVTIPRNTVFYAKHTVTDSQGTTYTHYSLVAVVGKEHANLIKKFRISEHARRPEGQTVRIDFDDAVPYGTYPDGTEILIAQRERYGATAGSLAGADDREHMLFAGWIYDEQNEGEATELGFIGRTSITAYDAALTLDQLPGFPTVVERDSAPAQWEQMKAANLDRYVHRILSAYSNVLTRACFTWSGTGATYSFSALGSDGATIYQQADLRTQAIAFKLTCDRHGRLAMMRDPMLAATANRTSTIIVPILETDWRRYSVRYTRPPRVHWNWGEAVVVTTADADTLAFDDIPTVFCVAPGDAPGQGGRSQTTGQQLVVSQSELNIREGHRYAARMNNRDGFIEVVMRGGEAGIEPALMEWVRFEVTSATSGPRGRTYSTTTDRFLPVEIRYEYNPENQTRITRVTIERETIGVPAVTFIPPQDPLPNYDTGDLFNYQPYPIVYTDPFLGIGTQYPVALVCFLASGTAQAYYGTLFDPATATVNWTLHNTDLTGDVIAVKADPFDYRRWFAITTTGLWRNDNLPADAAWTQVIDTVTLTGDANAPGYHIDMPITRRGCILIAAGRNVVYRSFDYGANWASSTMDGGAAQLLATGDFSLAGHIAVSQQDNGVVWGGHLSDAGNNYSVVYLRVSNDWGATWTNKATLTGWATARTGPVLNVPYMRTPNVPNKAGSSQWVYYNHGRIWGGEPSRLGMTQDGGTTWSALTREDAFAPEYIGAPNKYGLHTYTQDGRIVTYWRTDGNYRPLYASTDALATRNIINGSIYTEMFTATRMGINGWPSNPYFLIIFSSGGVYFTPDYRADVWISLATGLANSDVLYCAGDLSSVISPT